MRNLEKEQRLGRNGIENLCIKPTFNYCTGEEQFTFFKLPKCLIDDACFWGLSIVRNFDFYDYRVFISTGLELKKSKSNKTNINNTNFNNIYLILSERKNSILDRI